jgi:hypothetical protein
MPLITLLHSQSALIVSMGRCLRNTILDTFLHVPPNLNNKKLDTLVKGAQFISALEVCLSLLSRNVKYIHFSRTVPDATYRSAIL